MEDKNGKEHENEVKKSNNQTSDVTKETKETNPNQNSSNNNDKDTFQDYVAEFKKIVWPSKAEIFKKTTTVISMSIFVGIIIFGMDSVLSSAYTASLRAVRDDIPDYSSDVMFDEAMMQEMFGDQDFTVNEDGTVTINPTDGLVEVDGTETDGLVEIDGTETDSTNNSTTLDGITVNTDGADVEVTMTESEPTEYESTIDGMDLPEGAIPTDDGFIFDLNQYDFESDPLNLGSNMDLDELQSDLQSDAEIEEVTDSENDTENEEVTDSEEE